jgi:SAM-dependent methyltransferase
MVCAGSISDLDQDPRASLEKSMAVLGGHSGDSGVPKVYFDERVAAGYDSASEDMFDPRVVGPAVGFLADLADGGSALELGVGTGRIALPLSERGIPVHGIDISEPMVARLKAKPRSQEIGVTIGDFATTRVEDTFSLAYLVHNTITNLTTQDEQVECFRNVAAHLEPGGHFVIEVEVPQLRRLPPGEVVRAFALGPAHLGFDEYVDMGAQRYVSHHFWTAGGQLETFSSPHRFVWPSELDLMARLAGMSLRERWGSWAREPFTSDSASQVSVWEKAAEDPSGPGRDRATSRP